MFYVNPDGRKHAEAGVSWRKNTNENYCSPTSTDRGADLNRNFEFSWNICPSSAGCSSGSECSSTYRGPTPASEPETDTVQEYIRSIFPDQRDDPLSAAAPITATGVFLDIHASGDWVLWPWGFVPEEPPPNSDGLTTLGRKFAYFNDYYPTQATGLYPTDGATDDHAYGDLGLAAYTFELGTTFFQSCGFFEDEIVPLNMPALIYAAKAARTPYMTPSGPDTLDVNMSDVIVGPGSVVTLTAIVNDTRYSSNNGNEPVQEIATAEFYVDVPSWITSTVPIPLAMTPLDGSFNSSVETVVGVLDTTGLENGRHIIYLRGADELGNWGVFTAGFLHIIDPAVAPVFEGYVTAADTGFPLAAAVIAGPFFSTHTDPTTGYYSMQVISGTYDITASPDSAEYAASTAAGVTAHDLQTVQQDFSLFPFCDVFVDDVESGNQGWSAEPPWAITTESSHSPTHSWTDSPGGSYPNNQDASLISQPYDLSEYGGVILNYWQICNTETDYDYCQVEVSTDGGASWQVSASFDGLGTQWEEINLEMPEADGHSDVQIRFRLVSDGSIVKDGWHVDDIRLKGAGPSCVAETAPLASFESSSPDPLGTATVFTNTSTGGNLSYEWDFGDGSPSSTNANPSHIYPYTGTFTVTLTVSNSLGTESASGLVEIVEPETPLPIFFPVIISDEAAVALKR
jgi:carboxypeptidase T